MHEQLKQRFQQLRGRLRRELLIQGIGWTIFTGAICFLGITWTDWLVSFDWEVRLVLLTFATIAVVVVGVQTLLLPLGKSLDDLRLALRIEARWPELHDRLSSTIEFLRIDGTNAGAQEQHGSAALRAQTIEETDRAIAQINFQKVVDPTPTRHATLLAVWMTSILVGESLAAPAFQSIAVNRFFLGDQEWPKRTELTLGETTTKVARGTPFELTAEIAPGQVLPKIPPLTWFQGMGRVIPPLRVLDFELAQNRTDVAKVTYQFEDGEELTSTMRPDSEGTLHGRLDVVNDSFRFFVRSDDHSSPWVDVEVVPPPSLESVRILLEPPAYTSPYATPEERIEATEELADQSTQIRILQGTTVRFKAVANKPLRSVIAKRDKLPVGTSVTRERDRSQFEYEMRATERDSLWFELTDYDSFQNQAATRYELSPLVDDDPSVQIVSPEYDVSVPPEAVVPIALSATDDYGLRNVRLAVTIHPSDSAESDEQLIPLWVSEPESDRGQLRSREFAHEISIPEFGLGAGAMITVIAEAGDFFAEPGSDVTPHLGTSRELRIRVITPESAREQFDDRRREIRDQIARLAETQRMAIPPVRDAINMLDADDALDESLASDLQNALELQQQVSSQIDQTQTGLAAQLEDFLNDLENARLGESEMVDEMEQLRQAVDQVRAQNLRPAEQGIDDARETLRNTNQGDRRGSNTTPEEAEGLEGNASEGELSNIPDDQGASQEAKESLQESRQNQEEIANALDQMLDSLQQFETLRSITQEAESLVDQQAKVNEEAGRIGADPGLTGKTPDQLNPRQQAELENLAEQQRDVANEFDDLADRMERLQQQLEDSEPMAAEALKEALERLEDRATGEGLKRASEDLGENRMGAAQEAQERVSEDLRELVDSLKNRRENDLERLLKQLEETRAELAQMRSRQAELLDQTNSGRNQNGENAPNGQGQGEQGREGEGSEGGQEPSGGNPPPEARNRLQQLAKEQRDGQQELKSRLQRLQKLRAANAAEAARRAASQMGNAGQRLDEGEAGPAAEREREALNELDDAIAQTDDAIQNAKDRLLMEQFAKISDQLKGVASRQDRILEETQTFNQQQMEADGVLSRADRFDILNLGRAQDSLKDETQSLTTRLAGAPVFELALQRATNEMGEAAEGLSATNTGQQTQAAEQNASTWLNNLIESLQPEDVNPEDGQGQNGQNGQPGGGNQGNQGADGIPAEAQIRMLRQMQQDINARTQQLNILREQDIEFTEAQEAEFIQLGEDQRTIADLLRDLIRPKRPDGLED